LPDQIILLLFRCFEQAHQRCADDEPFLFFPDARRDFIQRIGQLGGEEQSDFLLCGFHDGYLYPLSHNWQG
jgi:hypothetical protein